MKEKQLKTLAAVFVFLLVVFVITKPRHRSVNLDEFVQNIVIGVAQDDVKGIEIYKERDGGDPVRMTFNWDGGHWRLPNYHMAKAQKSRVDRIITDALEMTGKVRTSDPKHHASFQITDEAGLHLLLKDETGKTLANLILGKKPEDAGNGFVRFAGNDKVYFTDKSLLASLSLYGDLDTLSTFNQKGFVDLLAVDQKKEDLAMIALVDGGKELVLKKVQRQVEVTKPDSTKAMENRDVWVLAQGQKETDLDAAEADKFIKAVTQIRGTEVVDQIGNSLNDLAKPGQYGMGRPSRYLVFRTPDGKQKNVIFGKAYEKDQGYYMQVQYDQGLVYKVAKATYDALWPYIDELPKKKK